MDITQPKSQQGTISADFMLDESWAKKAFIVPDVDMEEVDAANRYWSSASTKFTDTTLGGSIGINPKPQYTPYADPPSKGKLSGRVEPSINEHTGNYGLGRYYAEAIDDPAQVIYMQFGVPRFNTLTNFLRHAFDPSMITIARTGKSPSIFYNLGALAGTAATVIAFPAVAIAVATVKTINFFFGKPLHKFYTFQETMYNYWSAVNLLVNTHAINAGLFPKIFNDAIEALGSPPDDMQKIGQPYKLDSEYLEALSKAMPDVFKGNNYFDMYAIANKAQRLANQLFENDYHNLDKGTGTNFLGYVKKTLTGDDTHSTYISDKNGKATLAARFKDMLSWGYDKEEKPIDSTIQDPRQGEDKKDEGWWSSYKQSLTALYNDGAAFAAFRVDHTGSVQESFGNSVVESEMSQKLNSISSQVREARFSFAEGSIMGGLGDMVQSAVGAAADVAMGALDGATFGLSNVIQGLAGSGFIDIPKHWQSSTAQLPRTSYTIKLVSPYNNVISRMINIWIPFYMLLAGTLPLATGKASYTSPFLCQLFDRGRCQIRLGMIESLSITRGTTNLPFDYKGNALGIDVTFSVIDLSSIMHMPLSTGMLGDFNMTLDEDNILSDYMAVLAGMDLNSQIYAMPKAKLKLAKSIIGVQRLTSPSTWGSITHEFSKFIGVGNAIEGLSRGTDSNLRSGT